MKFKKILSVILGITVASSVSLCAVACGDNNNNESWTPPVNTYAYDVPQDYTRTYYEIFVRSFADGNGDGVGDFRGLINNLDYLNDGDDSTMTDLGVNGIWLMPINASPSYHGYDVTNYKAVNSKYGTLNDFDELIEECEARGIWVQMDLVLNHTSNQHPWFKNALIEARRGVEPEDSEYMNRYVFYHESDKPNSGKFAPVSGTDYYYLCNFDTGMPDLNYGDMETNGLKEELEDIVDFWLSHGVRSFRLDAVPYVFGSSGSSTGADNVKFWTWFSAMCDEKGREYFGDEGNDIVQYCYNVGEVWGSTTAINTYFGTNMSAFNYSMGGSADATFPTTAKGFNSFGAASYVEELAKVQADALAQDENAILSNFLSNHDNPRSSGYFSYDPIKIKTAAGLYLLAPGNPYIYYGEEIGAEGYKLKDGDTDANVRMAFNWGDNSKGIAKNPDGTNYAGGQRLGTWQSQTNNKDSILTYYRNAISLRNRFPEIGRGVVTEYAVNTDGKIELNSKVRQDNGIAAGYSILKVNSLNKTVAAYTLTWGDRKVLIVQNIGTTDAALDISAFAGYELVGELKANGGSVSLSGTKLNMSASTVAVLKVAQ